MSDMRTMFGNVIGIKEKSSVQGYINYLSEEAQLLNISHGAYRWRDLAVALPDVNIKGTEVLSGGKPVNSIKPQSVGAGTYGTCYISNDEGRIYKKIKITSQNPDGTSAPEEEKPLLIEAKIRGVYVETFIQTVLSNDPDVGHFICKPNKLYRNAADVTRLGLRSRGNNRRGDDITLYIQMEPIKYKFKDYLGLLKTRTGGRLLNVIDIAPVFQNLGMVLHKLQTNYGFFHGDLHCDNIMISESEQLKIIDFGFSCISYDGKNYRSVGAFEDSTELCFSLDILIFLTFFIQYYGPEYFSLTARNYFRNLLRYRKPDGSTFDLYEYLKQLATNDGMSSVFHKAYSWEIDTTVPIAVRSNLPALDPLRFSIMMREIVDSAAAAAAVRVPANNKTLMNYVWKCIGDLCTRRPRSLATRSGGRRGRRNTRKNRKH